MAPETKLKESAALSASKIKTFESCSWLYWCNYHLKLPQVQNDGAKKGEICHKIFELLINKKHYKKYKAIIDAKTITKVPSVKKLITKLAKKLQLTLTPEISLQLEKMIMVGLQNDFFVAGTTLVEAEYKFDLINEDPKYFIRGYMDKPCINDEIIIIDDYKSSKKKFEGEEQESNVQALIYSLAAKKIWPKLKPIIRFIFLQYPADPIMKVEFSDDTLSGFEHYLSYIQKKVDSFSEDDAKKNFAADQEAAPKEFKGKLLCGFASSPTQKKKDGSKMWHCPYKFAFDYYIITPKNGKQYTSLTDDVKLSEGDVIKKAHYDGCPRHNKSLNSFKTNVPAKTNYLSSLFEF